MWLFNSSSSIHQKIKSQYIGIHIMNKQKTITAQFFKNSIIKSALGATLCMGFAWSASAQNNSSTQVPSSTNASATSIASTQTKQTSAVEISAEQEQDLVAAINSAKIVNPIGLERYYYPSLGAGIPTGFGANWGDVMVGAAWSNSDKQRDEDDGSMSFTMGLLDSRKFVGLEVSANLLSMRNFGDNWNFDAKVHRILYEGDKGFLSLGVGRNNFACSGSNACSSTYPSTGGLASNVASNYVVLSGLTPVKNLFGSGNVPLNVSLGMGNGNYSNDMNSGAQYSVFGDIGMQFHDQVGAGVGWSGKGLNANLSFVPVRKFPLILNILFADVTNRTPAGFNVIVSAGMPFNFLQ